MMCHYGAMRKTPHYAEGPDAHQRFVDAMRQVISIPREEILRREAEYKEKAALRRHKRGPKPKQSSSSPSPDAQPLV